jgi:hypothetical protein
MPELRLLKLFAWVIGVLILLWMLTECLGGPAGTGPGDQDLERDSEQYAADCDRAWQSLDLVAHVDHQNVDRVVDQIEALGTDIADPNLKALAAAYARETQELVTRAPPGDSEALEEARSEYREAAALDLAMRCPVR